MGLQTSLDFFSTEGVSYIGITGEQEGIGRQTVTEQGGRSQMSGTWERILLNERTFLIIKGEQWLWL